MSAFALAVAADATDPIVVPTELGALTHPDGAELLNQGTIIPVGTTTLAMLVAITVVRLVKEIQRFAPATVSAESLSPPAKVVASVRRVRSVSFLGLSILIIFRIDYAPIWERCAETKSAIELSSVGISSVGSSKGTSSSSITEEPPTVTSVSVPASAFIVNSDVISIVPAWMSDSEISMPSGIGMVCMAGI